MEDFSRFQPTMQQKKITLQFGDSLEFYKDWDAPIVIVSDGPYGLNGYNGDLKKSNELAKWYEPHIEMWSQQSSHATTLWFWNTEIGWAEVHSVLKKHNWIYRSCNIWNKGIRHVSGNTNTKTLRRFPVVTEICAHYIRTPKFTLTDDKEISIQEWLRSEWKRTKLPFKKANEACGVKNAATRKYLTKDHLWYFPPPNIFDKLVQFANNYGNPNGKPYFSIDKITSLSNSQWNQLRGKFHCKAGITNVWDVPPIRNSERVKINGKALHPNQKPLHLMDIIIECSSDKDDVIWEPFGGLCSASISALKLGRRAFAAEIDKATYQNACKRIKKIEK